MACWSDLPMELRLMIFKVKRHNHFNERKDQLSELFKERTVKIIETEDKLKCTFTLKINVVHQDY